MPESTIARSENAQQKHFEVINLEKVDIVVNNDALSPPEATKLKELFKNGIPDSWQQSPTGSRFHYDSPKRPRYFAKTRQGSFPGGFNRETIRKRETSIIFERRRVYAFNSVVNEISLAPTVKAIVHSEEAQAIAREHGFKKLHFIEPLMAIIEKQTGLKTVIYRYVSGKNTSLIPDFGRGKRLRKKVTELTERLRILFRENGISPLDLHEHQFILNRKGAHLCDTEGFIREKP